MVFNDGDAVLHKYGATHAESAAGSLGRRVALSYLNVLVADRLQDPDVDVLLAYGCDKSVNVLGSKHTELILSH